MPLGSLPPAFDAIALGPLASIAPEALVVDPTQLSDIPVGVRTVTAVKYSRVGGSRAYDEIGFRLTAANLVRGDVPLQTLNAVRLERSRDRRAEDSDPIAAILEEEQKLRHRLFDLPDDSGRLRYRVEGRLLQLEKVTERRSDTETWTFPLTAPLAMLRQNAAPSDVSRLFTQQYRIEIPGAFWLPLSTLVARGRLHRYQDWRADVPPDTRPGHFYVFVSHRWLSPTEPDPDGTQAAFLAWQMIAYLCDAVRVARYRGLNEPRLRSLTLGFTVGISGSDLAEALVVNVLRTSLDETSLADAWAEARRLQSLTDNNGVSAAANDVGLARLRSVLAECPTLWRLVDRIHVWYDYACMPQPPRTPDDETTFRNGLQSLVAIQLLGHTVVLLDEAEEYLSRGWCTLEAIVADTEAVSMELLIGSARKTARDGTAEHYFRALLQDRPHIVWRAVLDTEVFRVQTEADCVARLALSVTDPRDLPFIYGQLRNLAAPSKIHVDDSELFTGAYPVAQAVDGSVVVPVKNERGAERDDSGDSVRSLDWTAALRLATSWSPGDTARPEPHRSLPSRANRKTCHVVVVAGCEGEAVLWSNWTIAHRDALEALLDIDVRSSSWLAADIAPVGHFICGTLQPIVVRADVWVIAATQMRLTHCSVTAALTAAVASAGVPVWSLALDAAKGNVRAMTASKSSTRRIRTVDLRLVPRIGGACRSELLDQLFGEPEPVASV